MPRDRDTKEFLKLARERFKQGQEAIQKQRERELADLAFYQGGEHQWDKDTLNARRAQQGGTGATPMPPVPARPTLTINKVREPVHQVLNQERQSDLTVTLAAADDFEALVGPIAETEIELREGLVRRIQRTSEAADARTWAFDRAVKCGIGYYVVRWRFVTGKSWDQEVYLERLFNQASVTLDPAHTMPDGSDCDWEFIDTFVPWSRYLRDHPQLASGKDNPLQQVTETDFAALGNEAPLWFKTEDDVKSVRVSEYFHAEETLRTLVRLTDGSVVWKEDMPPGAVVNIDPETNEPDEREVPRRIIKWAKIDGLNDEPLEETTCPGPDMPIIKVLGMEMQPFDQDRRVEGMIRAARDPQAAFNAMVSKWVEVIGLAPIPPFQLAEGQQIGYEQWYQAANTRTLPYLPYRTKDLEGTPVGAPIRTPTDTPIQAIAASVQLFDEAIQSTTSVPEARVGRNVQSKLKSGVALNEARQASEQGTSHFLDNLRRSVRYEGQILNNLLYPIYGTRPGRLVSIMTGEGESKRLQIGATNGNGGQPPMMGPPTTSALAGMRAPGQQKQYGLTKDANFNVVVKVTRGFDSRRDEESTTIGNLLQVNPEFMGWFGDLFFKNQDGPGHEEMAERAKVMLDPKIQQLIASKVQGEAIPPQIQAQMAQMKGQLQQAEQILAQAKQELESKHAEVQAKLQIAQLQRDQAIQLQQMKDATSIEVARITAAKEVANEAREDQEEAIALLQSQLHEAQESALDRQHEQELASRAQAHAVGMAGVGAQTASDQSTQEHEQGLEQQAAAAANQPAEADNSQTGA